jgi:hypothetical protein
VDASLIVADANKRIKLYSRPGNDLTVACH